MSIFCEEHKVYECECDDRCHTEINPTSTYARGHCMKTEFNRARVAQQNVIVHTGRVRTPEQIDHMSEAQQFARLEDPTINERIAETLTGRIQTDEVKQHHREGTLRALEADPTIGDRISEANTGKERTPEQCDTFSKAQLKSYRDDPTRADRTSASNIGKTYSEEALQNMREGHQESHRLDPTIGDRISLGNTGKVRTSEQCEDNSRRLKYFYRTAEGLENRNQKAERWSGEGNPMWSGGILTDYGTGWKTISELIQIRDGHVCQGCGSTLNIVTHHINGCVYDMDEHNLIAVCRGCNIRASVKGQIEYWIEFYTNRIREIYTARGGELILPQVVEPQEVVV